jgi:hypothetical protein
MSTVLSLEGAPWGVKVAILITFWFGPSMLVSAIFLGMWTGWLPSPITENLAIMRRVEDKLDTATKAMRSEVDTSRRSDEKVINILLATCQNIAKGDTVQVARCNDYWRR